MAWWGFTSLDLSLKIKHKLNKQTLRRWGQYYRFSDAKWKHSFSTQRNSWFFIKHASSPSTPASTKSSSLSAKMLLSCAFSINQLNCSAAHGQRVYRLNWAISAFPFIVNRIMSHPAFLTISSGVRSCQPTELPSFRSPVFFCLTAFKHAVPYTWNELHSDEPYASFTS